MGSDGIGLSVYKGDGLRFAGGTANTAAIATAWVDENLLISSGKPYCAILAETHADSTTITLIPGQFGYILRLVKHGN